ncbi:hypothetical protein F0562_023735 [Nyssa sinensis]|uniref:Uncharacterized protein n=1 Tax=Nyssa sinensis TaxID=561372 RepID=A0A5J5BH96_9ASTE|nr:hypothetical protein F0562_023735 [Nyssa sinensis]
MFEDEAKSQQGRAIAYTVRLLRFFRWKATRALGDGLADGVDLGVVNSIFDPDLYVDTGKASVAEEEDGLGGFVPEYLKLHKFKGQPLILMNSQPCLQQVAATMVMIRSARKRETRAVFPFSSGVKNPRSALPRREAERAQPEMKLALIPVLRTMMA